MNGPALELTFTRMSSSSTQPTPLLLSLTEHLKFISLDTAGNTSHSGLTLLTRSFKFGKTRVGEAIGEKDLKKGPSELVATGGMSAISLSICSQQ